VADPIEIAEASDKRSESSSGVAGNPGANPPEALAYGGLAPGRAPLPAAKSRDPEVVPKARRRTFTSDYKLRILREAAELSGTGGIGAMLRREGLYDTQLSEWRKSAAAGLEPLPRGPKPKPVDANAAEFKALRKKNKQLKRRLEHAELIIDIQKK